MDTKHTPGPWKAMNVTGAGLEIHAPVHLIDVVDWTNGKPDEPIMTFQLTEPAGLKLIACERWVQFDPVGWKEMQTANASLIAAAPELLYEVIKLRKELGDKLEREFGPEHVKHQISMVQSARVIAKATSTKVA